MAASLTVGVPALGTPILTEAAQGVETWPAESDVRLGVTYGPTGAEYTGTMTGGSGPTAEQIAAASAAAVLAAMALNPPPVNVTQFNGNLTQGTGRLGDPVRPA